MHALAPPPDLLLVDDLHALVDLPAGDRPRPRDMALCRVLAALHEAAVGGGRGRARVREAWRHLLVGWVLRRACTNWHGGSEP